MRLKDDNGGVKSSVYVFALTLFFTLVSNMPLWVSIYKSTNGKVIEHLGFYLSIIVFVFCLLYILMTVLVWPYVHRIILSVLLFISGVITYAALNYGTKVDSGVVQSVIFTSWGEIYAYFSASLMVWLFFIALIPIVTVWLLKVKFNRPFWKEILSKVIGLVIATLIMGVIFFAYSKEYFPYFRNHMSFRSMVNPINYISSFSHYIKEKYKKPLPFKTLGTDAVDVDSGDNKHNILVLVVGETARSMNYSINGYAKKTNPYLEKQGVISFRNFSSCGTYTAWSVPCMFSPMTREQYKPDIAHSEDGLLDVLNYAKINLLWRENDTGCYGVCDRIPHVAMKMIQNSEKYCQHGACYDGILLSGLRDYVRTRKQDTVIVLHLIGSHGPSYYQRYPPKFSTFKPSCDQANIQDCKRSSLINVYDNTLVYTDYVLDRVIRILKAQHGANTAMIYLSDHGESLGENGLYLHAAPYVIAPKEQTTVPFIVWLSKSMTQHKKLNLSCLEQESQRGGYSQDYLFSSVLGLMNVKTKVYKPALDVFSKCEI